MSDFGAFVVRNARGLIIHYQAKALLFSSVLEADVETLEWATSLAIYMNWDHIDWSMDAKKAVDLINSDNHRGWGTVMLITSI